MISILVSSDHIYNILLHLSSPPLPEGEPVSHRKSPDVGGAGLLTLSIDGKMYEHASHARVNFVIALVKYVTNVTLFCHNN